MTRRPVSFFVNGPWDYPALQAPYSPTTGEIAGLWTFYSLFLAVLVAAVDLRTRLRERAHEVEAAVASSPGDRRATADVGHVDRGALRVQERHHLQVLRVAHREQQRGPGRGDSRELRERAVLVVDVLDDVERADELERPVGERQRVDEPAQRVRPARAELADRGRAHVHEAGAFDRETRPQARADL